VGHLQRNKVKNILGRFHLFHGLESERLADEINRRAKTVGTRLDDHLSDQNPAPVQCLIQVNISEEETKYGVRAQDAVQFARSLATRENIQIRGLMGMARPGLNFEEIQSDFSRLRLLRDEIRSLSGLNFDSELLSMGMSQDFELAIQEGATHIRVGNSIFGDRNVPQPTPGVGE